MTHTWLHTHHDTHVVSHTSTRTAPHARCHTHGTTHTMTHTPRCHTHSSTCMAPHARCHTHGATRTGHVEPSTPGGKHSRAGNVRHTVLGTGAGPHTRHTFPDTCWTDARNSEHTVRHAVPDTRSQTQCQAHTVTHSVPGTCVGRLAGTGAGCRHWSPTLRPQRPRETPREERVLRSRLGARCARSPPPPWPPWPLWRALRYCQAPAALWRDVFVWPEERLRRQTPGKGTCVVRSLSPPQSCGECGRSRTLRVRTAWVASHAGLQHVYFSPATALGNLRSPSLPEAGARLPQGHREASPSARGRLAAGECDSSCAVAA